MVVVVGGVGVVGVVVGVVVVVVVGLVWCSGRDMTMTWECGGVCSGRMSGAPGC